MAKGEVCKTFIQGFESPPRLHSLLIDAINVTGLSSSFPIGPLGTAAIAMGRV